jgi:hypothetical protein
MFLKKPYEYDVNKKTRRKLYAFFIFAVLMIGALLYYYRIYLPKHTEILTVTEQPNNTTWIDVPYYKPVNAPILSTKNDRDPVKYYNVIAQFDVENAIRYQKNNGETFSNIFVWDVMRAMGVILPHYFDQFMMPSNENKYVYIGSENIRAHFLAVRGGEYGWKEVKPKIAQLRANQGYPTIGVWVNGDLDIVEQVPPDKPRGHMMVVRPSPTGTGYERTKGPYISQAGKINTMILNVSDVLGVFKMSNVTYYTHE